MEHVKIPWNEQVREIEITDNKDRHIKMLTDYTNYLANHLNNTIVRCDKLEKEINTLKQKL